MNFMKRPFPLFVAVAVIVGGLLAITSYVRQVPGPGAKSAYEMPEDGMAVATESVVYFGETEGYFATPEEPGRYPGVVMIHEWWGLNDNIKEAARALAAEGYNVLAVDLYEGSVAANPDEARQLVGGLDQMKATMNLQAAASYLRYRGSDQVASLGWCFGGRQSVELAISGERLAATVVYYGGGMATTTDQLAPIDWPVLGIFGDQDQGIPVETVMAFEASLDTLDVENEIYIYPGVGHAFANPSGASYALEETMDAWTKTLAFLARHLKGEQRPHE